MWEQQGYRDLQEKARNTPEFKEKMRKDRERDWSNPKYRKNMEEIMKSDEYIKKQRESQEKRWNKPGAKEAQSKRAENQWNNPKTKEKHLKTRSDPEYKKKQSEAMKGKRNAYKEIKNKRQFLSDIKNKMPLKDLAQKYGISDTTINERIKEYLGPHGIRNSTGAKEYLKDKNIDDVLKDIEPHEAKKQPDNSKQDEKLKDSEQHTEEQSDTKSHEEKEEEPLKEEKSDLKEEGQVKEEGEQKVESDGKLEESPDQAKKKLSEKAEIEDSESKGNESSDELTKGLKFENSGFSQTLVDKDELIREPTICEGCGPTQLLKNEEDDKSKTEKDFIRYIYEEKTGVQITEDYTDAQSKDYEGIYDFSEPENMDYNDIYDNPDDESTLPDESSDFKEDIFTEEPDTSADFHDNGWIEGESEDLDLQPVCPSFYE